MSSTVKAADKLVRKGWSSLRACKPDHALASFQRAVAAAGSSFEAHHGMASALQAMGDISGAIDAFENALRVAPGNADTLLALGRLARDLKAPEQAAGFFRQAAMVEPGSVPAQTGLAHALRDLGRQEEASDLLQSALNVQPEAPDLWDALGTVRADLEDFDNAILFLQEAQRLDPRNRSAAGNLAEALFADGRIDEAGQTYRRALKLGPDDPALRFNHAMFALSQGDLVAGWRDYEARLEPAYPGFVRRDLKLRRWRGPARPEGRLLVLAEQGVGDELHFLHCLPDVAAEWGEVWWECDPRLLDLLTVSYPEVTFVPWQGSDKPGFHRGYDWLADAPKFDACIEAGSLQTRYRADLDQFPRTQQLLKTRAAPDTGILRVGISWTSTHRNRLRDRGYVPLSEWGPILSVPGVRWVNVQYGDCLDELAEAEKQFGVSIEQTPGLDLKDDFSGTAELMAGLDLMIGPTNAARQLAASVGTRTLVLSRLPYEFGLGAAINPFFPHMTDFVRLPGKDWSAPVSAVAGEVAAAAAAKAQRAA